MFTVAELKTRLGITGTDHDVNLAAWEASAVAFCEGWTGRYFRAPVVFVETFSGGSEVIWLRETPAASPALVVATNDTGAWVTVAAADYEAAGAALYHTGYGWPGSRRNLRVTYTAGYAPGSEPGDIRQAVVDLVTLRFRRAGKEGIASEAIGGYSYSVPASHVFEGADIRLIPGLAATLDRWRRVRVG